MSVACRLPPMTEEETQDARRALVRALASGAAEPLAAWLDASQLNQEDLAWLHKQGLLVFAFYRLQEAALLAGLPAAVADVWQDAVLQATVATATLDWEIERVLSALAQAGVEFIWMKGAALAHTVYPNPIWRGRGDLDLWIQLAQLTQATSVLQGLGYLLGSKHDRPDALARLVGGEQQMVGESPRLDLIELQWPAMRGEWVRHAAAVDHAGIWQRRRLIDLAGLAVPIMAPEDTLIHLCFHQAINHQFGMPWLRNLLDVHLLVAAYPLDWSQVIARADAWRLATVVWTVLTLAQRLLGTTVPAARLHQLAPIRWRRAAIDRLRLDEAMVAMAPGGYGYRRFLIQMALVDRPRDVVVLFWRGLFPDASWLHARYSAQPNRPLWRLRLAHVWSLATSARV